MRIGIVKLTSLGDVVHALPVARALRQAFPDADLTWVAEAREAAVLRGQPDLDRAVTVDMRTWRRSWRSPQGLAAAGRAIGSTLRVLRGLGLDVVIDCQGLLKSAAVTVSTGARIRIGFAGRRCREPLAALATNRRVTPPPEAVHVVEQYLALLAPLGVGHMVPEFRLARWPEAEARVGEALAARGIGPGERVVLLNPGAGRPDKRWPGERFRALAARLSAELGLRPVAVWGPGEEALAREVAGGDGHVVVAPPTDLTELASLCRRATLMVAADTGPLHLAVAVGTPALGLFGPTRGARNGPYGALGRALDSPDQRMTGLAVEAVAAAAAELLRVARAGRQGPALPAGGNR